MTKARDLSDIVSALSSNAGKAVIVKGDGSELIFGDSGATEFYGFKYVDNDFDSFNETLQVTTIMQEQMILQYLMQIIVLLIYMMKVFLLVEILLLV